MRLVIQSSAIRAAVLEDKDEPDDADKPMSREELKARAMAQAARQLNEVQSE